jgi:hypothetical protein
VPNPVAARSDSVGVRWRDAAAAAAAIRASGAPSDASARRGGATGAICSGDAGAATPSAPGPRPAAARHSHAPVAAARRAGHAPTASRAIPLGACLSIRQILLAKDERVGFRLPHEQDIPRLED